MGDCPKLYRTGIGAHLVGLGPPNVCSLVSVDCSYRTANINHCNWLYLSAFTHLSSVHPRANISTNTCSLSIIFVATEIARGNKKTLTYRYPVLVASSFGLLHGFGFASVLREVGLPATELPTALLFFNVGVEIGQIVFVLIIFGVAYSARAVGQHLSTHIGALNLSNVKTSAVTAYTVGAVASFWTLERILAFWT